MSLLAALAKGLGAGTLQNAQAGFNEQTRQKEEDRRRGEMQTQILASRSEMDAQLRAQDKHLQTQLAASKEENRLSREAQALENQKNRDHELAMFERRLAEATREASNSGSVRARENHFKSLAGTFDALSKRKSEILESDKFMDQNKRDEATAEIDHLGAMLASDPGTQALMNEFGGGGYIAYWGAIGDEAAAHEQPQQQQGSSEPDNSQSTQPTNAPSRPGVKLVSDWKPSLPAGYQPAPQPKAFTGGGAPQPQGYQQPGGRTFFGDDLPDAYSTATGIIGRMLEQQSSGPSPQQAAARAWAEVTHR